jgi:NitT/TauT family transport system substrate-binding protein
MRRLLSAFAIASCLLISLMSGNAAAEPVKIKFTLDWKLQGIHAWYYWAKAKGYFAAENLDVRIDQGEGSAATVTRIMSGAYDAGFGDINAIIFKLLPLLAKQNGIDYSKINITQLSPSLQEQMLLQGQVDSVAVFTATSYMNLVSLKLDPDKDFRWMYYSDLGLDLSNGIMVSPKLAREHPEAVKGLLRAINRSLKETVENPDAAIALLATEEPLIKNDVERRRLLYVYQTLIDTPETRELGIGEVSDIRLKSAIATIATSFELPRLPNPGDIFDHAFLPAKAERIPPEIAP